MFATMQAAMLNQKNELKNQRLEISEKSSKITKLVDIKKEFHEEVSSKTTEVAKLLEEKSQLEKILNDFEKTAEEHDQEHQQAIARLQSELDSRKNQIAHLQDTVKKLQAENTRWKRFREEEEKDSEIATKKELDSQKTQIALLQDTVKKLQSENAQLKEKDSEIATKKDNKFRNAIATRVELVDSILRRLHEHQKQNEFCGTFKITSIY